MGAYYADIVVSSYGEQYVVSGGVVEIEISVAPLCILFCIDIVHREVSVGIQLSQFSWCKNSFCQVVCHFHLPSACSEDDGNYSYLTDEEAGIITIDTVGVENKYALSYSLSPGQHVEFEPRVNYKYPERLRYSWYYLTLTNYQYLPVQQGNSLVYQPADTICHTKKLDWTVDLNPGQYRFFLMAEDTITGMKGFYQAGNYTTVASGGTLSGLYLLTERDGQTDLEVFTSGLMLIYGEQSCHYKYYSVEGAIDAWQVIYDKQNRKFRPYFSQASQVSSFKSTSSDAVVDANNVQGNVKAVFQSGGNYTTVITEIADTIFAKASVMCWLTSGRPGADPAARRYQT